MQDRLKRLLVLGTASASVLALAACSSSSKSTSPGTTGSSSNSSSPGTTGSASQGDSSSAAVQAANSFIAPYLKAPTSIGITDKLSKNPGAGKKIVFITCEVPTCTDFYTGFKSAAAQFSWNVTELIASAADPSANAKQMQQAISLKPDAIVITGGNVPTWKAQLDAAKAAKIPVFGTSMETYDTGDATGLYSTIPDNPANRTQAGKLMGNWIIADSNARANVVDVGVPELKIPYSPYSDVTAATLAQACPETCKTSDLEIPYGEVIGGKAPGEIVSFLQSHPKVTYVNMNGGFETGVSAAIKQAGISGIKVLDASSNQAVEAGVISGEYSAALGYDALLIGWYTVNAIARHLVGLPAGDSAKPTLPTQLLLKNNISKAENYQQPADYQQQFRTLWGLS